MSKPPVIIHGQKTGRFRASWLLFKESWRFFKADPELFWVPIIFGVLCLVSVAVLVGLLVVGLVGYEVAITGDIDEIPPPLQYGFIFLFYVACAFTYALSQASVVHTVFTRVRGGDATLGESIKMAFSFSGSLFIWSLITSTVGIILYIISEKSKLFSKIVVWLLGATWSVLTYFVVTAVVLEKQTAYSAIKRSGQVFKTTWGETFVSNISLGLTFFLAHIVALLAFIGFIVVAAVLNMTNLYIVGFVLYAIWLFMATFVHEVLHAVLKTLLFIYATEEKTPENFDRELLANMLARSSKYPDVQGTLSNTIV